MPRTRPQYEVWVLNVDDLRASVEKPRSFSFDPEERVLTMRWISLPGLPTPALAVGTGLALGEDLTCRGRVLVFSVQPGKEGSSLQPPIFQRCTKGPVTVINQWGGNYLVYSTGFKIFFQRWEPGGPPGLGGVVGAFRDAAFHDGHLCVTAVGQIKNFLLFGDIRKGLAFVRWKEDTLRNSRTLSLLSRSDPAKPLSVLACDFVVCQKSLGLVALDHLGNCHLFQYSAHSDGREGDQTLRSCAVFGTGGRIRASLRVPIEPGVFCLFLGSGNGALQSLRPIDDKVYRTVTTLVGMLTARLPSVGGLNPRAARLPEGRHAATTVSGANRRNIEDATLLRSFAFLSAPLQAALAERMRVPLKELLEQVVIPLGTSHLYFEPQGGRGAAKSADG